MSGSESIVLDIISTQTALLEMRWKKYLCVNCIYSNTSYNIKLNVIHTHNDSVNC